MLHNPHVKRTSKFRSSLGNEAELLNPLSLIFSKADVLPVEPQYIGRIKKISDKWIARMSKIY